MDFVDLAHNCAPSVAIADLAAIVQVQSGFDPYVIRTNSGQILEIQPKSFDEAIDTATSLTLKGEDIEMGLTGITIETLNGTGKGIRDAFDPCQNLQMAAGLLTSYQARAANRQETLALFYGHGDMQAGIDAGYAKTIDFISAQLTGKLEQLQLKPGTIDVLPIREWTGTPISPEKNAGNLITQKETQAADSVSEPWDVFEQSKTRANIFFQER